MLNNQTIKKDTVFSCSDSRPVDILAVPTQLQLQASGFGVVGVDAAEEADVVSVDAIWDSNLIGPEHGFQVIVVLESRKRSNH